MAGETYDAFVSYRRSDGAAAARWIRRELEGFRPPRTLAARYGRKLRLYLDTAYERGTSDFYDANIRPSLLASRHLIIVATPDAVRRPGGAEDWIQREIDDFAAGPNGHNLFVVRAAGAPGSPLPGDLDMRFPNVQVVDLRGAGRLWWLQPLRAARLADAKATLVAPLLGLAPHDMPLLRQEEERRQQTRIGVAAGVTLAVLGAVSGLAVVALRSRLHAERALESSMFATGRTVLSVARGLGDEPQLADLRERILSESCDLIDRLRADAVREPGVAELIACAVERARAHEAHGEAAPARAVLENAVHAAAGRAERQPSVRDATALLDGRRVLAELLERQGDGTGAEAELGRLVEDARRYTGRFEHTVPFVSAQVEARAELARRARTEGRAGDAAIAYGAAADVGIAPEAGPPTVELVRRMAELRERSAEAYATSGNVEAALQQVRAVLGALDGLVEADRLATWVHVERAACLGLLGALESVRGHRDAALGAHDQALVELATIEPAGDEWTERVRGIRDALDAIAR